MKNLLFMSIIALALYACDSNSPSASAALTSFDACSCAGLQDNTSEDFKKCKELRLNAQFEADYQKCAMAKANGVDTSRITIQNTATATNLKAATAGTYSFVAGASKITWFGEKATGKKHSGSLNVNGGSVVLENGNISSGEIVIDMNSLVVLDQTGESKAKLEGHLKSDDFFGVSKFAEAKFVISSSKAINPVQYEVLGNLTIKGITKEVTCNLVLAPNGADELNIGGGFQFDRSQFDVRYGSDTFFDNLGNDMIKDLITLTINIKAKKVQS